MICLISCRVLKTLFIRVYLGFYESVTMLTVIDTARFLGEFPIVSIIVLNV
ncbi:hypothetical protein D3C80_455520 [compost metagenome]